jgi:glycosyltransferase involved in cell wall biosynthesis
MPNSDLMFSIVIPTYNRANFILKTVESYLQQDYSNFEIIVVDDGSTDSTKKEVLAIKDKRVNYCYMQNSERGAARNFGVRLAKGDYINFCDSDDYVYKNHLTFACNFIVEEKPSVFHTGYNIISNDKIEFTENPSGVLNEFILKGNILALSGVFVKREIALKYPFVEKRGLAGSEDWLQWLVLSANYDILGSEEVTSAYVLHGDNSMFLANGENTSKRISLLKKSLEENVSFQNRYGSKMPVVSGSGDLLIALDFALEKQKGKSLRFLVQSLFSDPSLIFSRRVFAVLKYLLLRW